MDQDENDAEVQQILQADAEKRLADTQPVQKDSGPGPEAVTQVQLEMIASFLRQ